MESSAGSRVAYALAYIVLGFFLKEMGIFKSEDGESLLRIIFTVTLPAVLMKTFVSVTFNASSVTIMSIALCHSVIALGVGWLLFRNLEKRDAALLAGSSVGVNLGLFVYPFAEAIWGLEGLIAAVTFDLANQWSILLTSYAMFRQIALGGEGGLSGLARTTFKRIISTPCLLAVYAALFLQVTKLPLPGVVDNLLTPLATANKPVALLALGIMLNLNIRREQRQGLICLLGARYGVALGLAGLLALFFPAALPPNLYAPVLVAICAPVPLLSVQYAVEFACNSGVAAAACNLTNVLSFGLLVAVSTCVPAYGVGVMGIPMLASSALCFIGVRLTLPRISGSLKPSGSPEAHRFSSSSPAFLADQKAIKWSEYGAARYLWKAEE
ncbi:hypothetical protein CYMTET_30775 [Cymbomonas tetramitiformis]|uniref:Uncharacterized protein n=1 Tax=Cymbomonas tetramitiformis TaxID=36881 RepID=A0AAE0FJM8_9CHLO|nr:hypothetical protein CYMTET_30775 [Cymbomonas tetramitiformis]